jgi:hypothetical protein
LIIFPERNIPVSRERETKRKKERERETYSLKARPGKRVRHLAVQCIYFLVLSLTVVLFCT